MTKALSKLSDRELLAKLRSYNNTTTTTPADYNLTAGDTTALKDELDEFEADLDAWDAVQDEYAAGREKKNASRRQAQIRGGAQRKLTRDKQDITPEMLERAGLEPYDRTRTESPSPTSAPFAIVEFSKLRHELNFRDSATPDTDAKPEGILGCEIWRKIGGDVPPVDNTGCEYLATDTATPYLVTYTGADAGKTVWYLLRWVSKNSDKGEWSEAVAATVNG